MAIPASRYPALKTRDVLRLLGKIGYEIERQRGSHRKGSFWLLLLICGRFGVKMVSDGGWLVLEDSW